MSTDPSEVAAEPSLLDKFKASLADADEDAEDARNFVEAIFEEALKVVRDPASAHVSFDSLARRIEVVRDSITGRNQEAPAAETVVIGQPGPAEEAAEPPSSEPASSEAAEDLGGDKLTVDDSDPDKTEKQEPGGEESGVGVQKEAPESTGEQAPSELGTTAS
jgi:hypothetical protein